MTQRDVVGREVGGGFMFGNSCTPVVDSCQGMAKPIQYCKKKFSFKKPFKVSGLSFKRNRKEGGGDSSASSPTEEEQEQGEISACGEEGTAQEGKAAATPESQEPQAKGAEASAAAKGGDTEEAGPQAAEPSTPSGPESDPAPASEQNE